MTYDELKRALLTIKEECRHNYNCDSCMVKQLTGVACMDTEPDQWTFEEENEKLYNNVMKRMQNMRVTGEREIIITLEREIRGYRKQLQWYKQKDVKENTM